MIDENAIVKAGRRWIGKQVYIHKGYYQGHWGTVASAESEDTFIVRGGTLDTLEPLIGRDEFRVIRKGDYQGQIGTPATTSK